jgi:elongation factor Ts
MEILMQSKTYVRTKVAANRSDRESTEGAAIAVINADKTAGVVITLNCETDFVGMNEAL